MGRKSLGGRAAAVLLENDDELERLERRKSLSREKFDQDVEQKAKKSTVNYDFTSVISLCSANKVNLKNTWSLDLIDHIDDVLELQNGSFQKASCTLQASVQIYEKRVDSTHQDTFKMLENVNRTRIGNAGDAEESRETRKKGTSNKSVSTFLENNLSNITHSQVEKMYEVDPLFRKMSKTFDAGGARGLLLNHLKVHQGPNVVFDTSETKAFPDSKQKSFKNDQDENPAEEEQQEEKQVDQPSRSAYFKLPEGLVMPATNTAPVCPSLELLHRAVDSSARREPTSDDEDEDIDLSNQVDEQVEIAGPEEDFYADDEENGFIFDNAPMDDDLDDDDAASIRSGPVAEETVGTSNQSQKKSTTGEIDFTQTTSYSFFRPEQIQNSRGAGWAGPSHWKFARKSKAVGTGTASATKKNTARRKLFFLDLFDGESPEIALSKRASTINLSKKSSATSKMNDLPEDLHYTVQDLCKLFLKPAVISEVLGRGADQPSAQPRTSLSSDREDLDFDGDNAAGFFDDYEAGQESAGLEIDGLVAPSHVVEKVQIQFERRAKKVDVKKLKRTLWEQVEDLRAEPHAPQTEGNDDGEENERHQIISFVDSITSASPKINDPDVTVPFYFICMLHLANENNLELQGRADLSDFSIA